MYVTGGRTRTTVVQDLNLFHNLHVIFAYVTSTPVVNYDGQLKGIRTLTLLGIPFLSYTAMADTPGHYTHAHTHSQHTHTHTHTQTINTIRRSVFQLM